MLVFFCVVESEKDALRLSSEVDCFVGELRGENAGDACFKEMICLCVIFRVCIFAALLFVFVVICSISVCV